MNFDKALAEDFESMLVHSPEENDRHAPAVHRCLTELLPRSIRRQSDKSSIRCVEVGCGNSLAFTGSILRIFAEAGVENVSLSLVDPALRHETLIDLEPFRDLFEELYIEIFPGNVGDWCKSRLEECSSERLDLAVSVQFTSLLSDTVFPQYLGGLRETISESGCYLDICEDNDLLTDPGTWGNVRLHGRSLKERIELAHQNGFRLDRQLRVPAHANSKDDGHVMSGVLLTLERQKL